MLLQSLILKGMLIGVIVSAPVGPVGLMCMQRTIYKGRAHGFATAVGATLSDLIYAVMAVFSLSFVIDFIDEHKLILRMIACAVIFAYGLYTLMYNPTIKLQKMKKQDVKQSYISDLMSSFGLTITNPLVVLLFLALFAKFDYLPDNTSLLLGLAGIFFILIGSSIWWLALVNIVSLFKEVFNIRRMYRLNQVVGAVLMIGSIATAIFWNITK